MIAPPSIRRMSDPVRSAVCGIVATLMLLFFASDSRAELILGAGVRATYEDNIVGLLTGGGGSSSTGGTLGSPMGGAAMRASSKGFGGGGGAGSGTGGSPSYTGSGSMSPGDISLTADVELGGLTEVGDSLSLFATAFAERTDYQTFSEYDSNLAGVAAGMTARTGDVLSLHLSGYGRVKQYDNNPDRDGTGYSGSAGLKQRVSNDLWLRETAEYNTYRAAYNVFSYRGTSCRFITGYDLTDDLLLTAGYGFQAHHYQDIAATSLRTRTTMLAADYSLTERWSTWLLYERQTSSTGTSTVITRNNLLSLAIRWDY